MDPELIVATKKVEVDGWKAKHAFDPISEDEGQQLMEGGNTQLITWRWVVVVKPDGRVKARAVLRGFQDRRSDVDTNAPTPHVDALRAFWYAAMGYQDPPWSGDVTKAFLNAPAPADVCFIICPLTLDDSEYPQGFWKANRALYGLKDAPKLWYEEIRKTLVDKSWQATMHEPCLFTRKEPDGRIKNLLLLYVDDLAVAGDDAAKMIVDLGYDLGELHPALGKRYVGVVVVEEDNQAFLRLVYQNELISWRRHDISNVVGQNLDHRSEPLNRGEIVIKFVDYALIGNLSGHEFKCEV